MDKLKKLRGVSRSGVTKTIAAINVELAKDPPDKEKAETELHVLEVHFAKLEELDHKIHEKMMDDGALTDADWDTENDSSQDYMRKVVEIRYKIGKAFASSVHHGHSSGSSPSGSDSKKSYKLPKIELKKFSGSLTEWLGWWAQFQKIDEDKSLHNSDKFQYLVQSMKPATKARDLVERYPQTEENYPKVIDALKVRFGKKKLLKQVYVRELISMIIQKGRDKSEPVALSNLYDKLESHLRSLESLGVTVEQTVEFLFPMVESCLPDEIMVAWQRSPFYGKDGSQDTPPRSELDFLLEFIRMEIESEEQRSLAKAGFGLRSQAQEKKQFLQRKSPQAKRKSFKPSEERVYTAQGLFNGDAKVGPCIFCDGRHGSSECFSAVKLTLEAKKERVNTKKACHLCLKVGHFANQCKAFLSCVICGKKHTALMCPQNPANQSKSIEKDKKVEEVGSTHTNVNCTAEIILQTLLANVQNEETGKSRLVRALIDNGSQRSYIAKTAAEEIRSQSSESITLNHFLFGGSEMSGRIHKVYNIDVASVKGGFSIPMEVLEQPTICGNIPRIQRGSWMNDLRKERIYVPDLSADSPGQIEMLIGADNLGLILTGKIIKLKNGLSATQTRFGWTLMGRMGPREGSSVAMNVISANITSSDVSVLWSLETIGIQDPVESKSRKEKEQETKDHFMQTVTRNEEGRYAVSLPWVNQIKSIPSNRQVAEKRLCSATSKLISMEKFKEYEEIFSAREKEGIISQCYEENPRTGCHYLLHRAVFKPESRTTPIRPVFDASCKVGRSPSLNECMEKGPNLLELIPSILHRIRLGRIGVIADIRKAFLMVEVHEEDRDFLRFLWWEDPERKKTKIFRHNRVVFGVNSSPFLLGAVIEYHLGQVKDRRQPIAEKLLKSLYVDNAVLSVNSIKDFEEIREVSTQIMAEAKMELRQWEFSNDNSKESITSVLGLKWEKTEDQLFCDVSKDPLVGKITKRVILSQVHRVFDPIGFLCPALLVPKLMLQRTWIEKMGWDEAVPEDMAKVFMDWHEEMTSVMDKIRIPRNVSGGEKLEHKVQLHVFSDASKAAYAAVVFLRVESKHGVSVQLLEAKSRVAPRKASTIPRLELLSCTIGARLHSSVRESLLLPSIPSFFWSDSTTALAWIRRNDDWGTFVGNRVREMCSLTEVGNWRHVPGLLNPADLPSRGCNPRKLLYSKWWEGPEWLKLEPSQWPSEEGIVDEELVLQEKRKNSTVTMVAQSQLDSLTWIQRKESFIKNVRVFALVLRFVKKLRSFSEDRVIFSHQSDIMPSSDEVKVAEEKIFQLIQKEVFPQDQSVIEGLKVERDHHGLIRVKTKLTNRKDSFDFVKLVLLPSSHPMVDQLIREEHLVNGHAGVQFIMGKLRERVWVIHGRRTIRRVLNSCTTCKRFEAQSLKATSTALPEDRVKDAKAFEVTGVDLAGPLTLRNKQKAWIVLFTCAVYRCVHLELVQSLTTEDFLMAFTRFCNRKRRPTTVYSDNGTNFGGAVNLFKLVDWKEVEKRTAQKRIYWRFNPPSAPWWGGWWERLIRSTKSLLKRMLGFGKLSYSQLETCLCEVESCINHRPLTFVTEDEDDLIPITPAMFLHDLPVSECTESKLLKVNLQDRVKNMRELGDELRRRFRDEYLAQLVQRGKEHKSKMVKAGDVVLVGSDNRKRVDWP